MSALGLILLSTAILIAPSMQHRIVEAGQSTPRLIRTTNMLSGAALIPLAIGTTLSAYIVTQRAFGPAIGIATAGLLFVASTFCWFGLEFLVGRYRGSEKMQTSSTPLKTKIEQLLTEARSRSSVLGPDLRGSPRDLRCLRSFVVPHRSRSAL